MMVTIVVEGPTDRVVAERIVGCAGLEPGFVYVTQGKAKLLRNLAGYNQAARLAPWFVLCDLDREPCAPKLVQRHLSAPAAQMCFRVAVRETEAWLLADVDRVARFLGIPPVTVPAVPETLLDPKEALVSLARKSRNRLIREDMVPSESALRQVGPGYEARIIEFASTHWRPQVAADRSPSLARCIEALRRLKA